MRKPKLTIIIPLGKNRDLDFLKNLDEIKHKAKIIIIKGDNPSRNRNKGISKAKTELVAFINGHTALTKNWIEQVLNFFKEYPDIDVVGGPQLAPPNSGFFEKASDYALSSKFGAANVSRRYKADKLNLNADETMLTSANLICRKKVVEKVKFDETLYPGEDPKFIEDCKKQGFNVAYNPKIITYNKRRSNLLSLIKQIYLYGLVRPKKENLKQTLKHSSFLAPSAFLIYLVIFAALVPFIQWKIILAAPLFLYIIINLLFSLIISIKSKKIFNLLILPLIYISIHLSYGAGFLMGLIKK